MKIETTAGAFFDALKLPRLVSAGLPHIPILGCVRLTVRRRRVTVEATDLDMWVETTMAASSGYHGKTCVELRPLAALLKTLCPTEPVTLESRGEGATLRFGETIVTLPTLPPSDFPDRPAPDADPDAVVIDDPGSLSEVFKACLPFVSTQETRYYLNGVCLDLIPQGLAAVATDGYTLLRRLSDCNPANWPDGFRPIVPIQAARICARHLTGKMVVSAKHVSFAGNGIVFVSRLIDGRFPDYNRVIPDEDARAKGTIPVQEIRAFLRQQRALTIKADSWSLYVQMAVTPSAGMRLAGVGIDGSGIESDIAGAAFAEPVLAGFNTRYLERVLKTAGSQTVEFWVYIKDRGGETGLTTGPCGVFDANDDVALVMPMRIKPHERILSFLNAPAPVAEAAE